MKPWLLASMVLLAIIVLVSPGIIGHLAERAIDEQIDYAEERDPGFAVAKTSYERGWFTSTGQHRIPVVDPDLADLLLALVDADADAASRPVLIIDTRLDHGLLPIGAAGRDLGALLPAIASGLSTLQLELAPGEVVALPGSLHSRIGIAGGAHFNYRLPAGSSAAAGRSASWSGANLLLTSSPDGRQLAADLQFDEWAIDTGDAELALGSARLQSTAEMTGWGFAIGQFSLTAEDASAMAAGDLLSFQALTLSMSSALQNDRMHGALDADITQLQSAARTSDVRLRSTVADLDPQYLGAFLRRVNEIAGSAGEPGALGAADLEFEARRLLSAGATITVQELRVMSELDDFLASVELSLPRNDELQEWISLLLALQGKAELELPVDLFASNPELATQLQPLIAAGFLIRKDGIYRMTAAYAKGLATVNGVPMPIPLPGMQRGN